MGKYIKSHSNKSPVVTETKKKLSTRREVCEAIERHAKKVVEDKHEGMKKWDNQGTTSGIDNKRVKKKRRR